MSNCVEGKSHEFAPIAQRYVTRQRVTGTSYGFGRKRGRQRQQVTRVYCIYCLKQTDIPTGKSYTFWGV